ncbi:MAG TPA: hypothetical protein VHK24_12580 [Steroidobacter sp.]|jgi:hypothetical protein|nr:hypothetical protein [Steroidobacter sp.]
MRLVAQHDATFELRELRLQFLDQRQKRGIQKQPAILGVVNDVGDLILE